MVMNEALLPLNASFGVRSYENKILKCSEEGKMSSSTNWNQAIIEEFRANGGKVGGGFAGKTLLILHTIGAKSGQERVNPVAYVRDGDRYVIIASKGGAPANPDWYRNLLAHPTVTVETGTETFQARADVTEEPERSRLYAKMVAMMPGFAEYERKTKRVIPVITLKRVE
jgi:deazaflavin-dependent oxidoreductase (nitroreductase family)